MKPLARHLNFLNIIIINYGVLDEGLLSCKLKKF